MTHTERNNNPQTAKIAGKAAFGPQPSFRGFGGLQRTKRLYPPSYLQHLLSRALSAFWNAL